MQFYEVWGCNAESPEFKKDGVYDINTAFDICARNDAKQQLYVHKILNDKKIKLHDVNHHIVVQPSPWSIET